MVLALVTSSLAHVASTWPQTKVVVIPGNVSEKDFGKFYGAFHRTKPTLVCSCFDLEDDQEFGDTLGYDWVVDGYVSAGAKVLHIDSQFSTRWKYANEMPLRHMKR